SAQPGVHRRDRRPAAAAADVGRRRGRQLADRSHPAVHGSRIERARPRRRQGCDARNASPSDSRRRGGDRPCHGDDQHDRSDDRQHRRARADGERHGLSRHPVRHGEGSGERLMNNDYGDLRLDAGLALTGPYDQAYLSGAVTIDQGVIYAPEPTGRHLIGAGDPALFNVLDTTLDADRNLFPPKSPLIANLRMEVAVSVKRNTWVRNREANVEIYTDDPVFVRDEQEAFLITGVVTTDRGEYNFLSKRFQIQRGSAMFIGSPDLNPTLQITGEYQVDVASRGALNIRVVIGGTLKHPNLSLESDAQPPKTQSELLTLLAFGQSTT